MKGKPLQAEFYKGSTPDIAVSLLGKVLLHIVDGKILSGRITETEAYLSQGDPACHASRGMTPRNRPMFGPPGRAYVYFIYGNHFCFNVVTAAQGIGEAVLIRALEPLSGLEEMFMLRNTMNKQLLCSGPGRLCQALRIDRNCNEADLSNGRLLLLDDGYTYDDIVAVPRIGIKTAVNLPLRFYPAGNRFVSRRIRNTRKGDLNDSSSSTR
ncbi:MAG: DNA-3-methyladenine glycosylase [bacterium]|nr:DNA-3-methyladenine glycosylase [bacterium]MDD3805862.1 DNA-3-methyladenine glycosylase [bacterium]MDD4152721.1 DNA-3-methyladenine glycosylase [bacterium]MDD4558610.1 DNA-3-methyladenine glycosylase [bacterium]